MGGTANKILVVSSSIDETVDYMLGRYGSDIEFFRLDVDNFAEYEISITEDGFSIASSGGKLCAAEVLAIYYRKPKLPAITTYTPEYISMIQRDIIAVTNGLVDAFSGRVLTKPSLLRRAENKIFQLLLAKNFGLQLPVSCITNDIGTAESFFKKKSIIKPISIGKVKLGERYNLHGTNMLKPFAETIAMTPIYLQEYQEKCYEVRLTVVDGKFYPVKILAGNKLDWRMSLVNNIYMETDCPTNVRTACLAILETLGMNFAAFDFIVTDEGDWIFLEFNPNGQWLWLEMELKLDISKQILSYLTAGTKNYDV